MGQAQTLQTHIYKRRIWCIASPPSPLPPSLSLPLLLLSWPKQDSLLMPSPPLIWVPGLWVTTWRRHGTVSVSLSVLLNQLAIHPCLFTNCFHVGLTALNLHQNVIVFTEDICDCPLVAHVIIKQCTLFKTKKKFMHEYTLWGHFDLEVIIWDCIVLILSPSLVLSSASAQLISALPRVHCKSALFLAPTLLPSIVAIC